MELYKSDMRSNYDILLNNYSHKYIKNIVQGTYNETKYQVVICSLQKCPQYVLYNMLPNELAIIIYEIKYRGIRKLANILTLGKQYPMVLTRQKIKLLKLENRSNCSLQKLILSQIFIRIPDFKSIELCLYRHVGKQYYFQISYSRQFKNYVIYHRDNICFFDQNKNLPQTIEIIKKLQAQFKQMQNQKELQQQLTNYSLIGTYFRGRIAFYNIRKNQVINQAENPQHTKDLLKKYNLDYDPEVFDPKYRASTQQQLINRLQQVERLTSKDKNYIQNKILRIVFQYQIICEFIIQNTESKIYQQIKQCLNSKLPYQNAKRNKFPAGYYIEIYTLLKSFPISTLGYYQKLSIVQYSLELKIPIQRILKSEHMHKIANLQLPGFKYCQFKTFYIYLIIGPVGMKKTQIFETLEKKISLINSQAIMITKFNHKNFSYFDEEQLAVNIKRQDLFQKTNCEFILLDLPFYDDLPEIIYNFMHENCPVDKHFRIFHIVAECQSTISFKHEKLDRIIQFPFSAELIIYCLRNIQARKTHPTLNGNSIQSLSKTIHYICSTFKNLKYQRYETFRQSLIKIDYTLNIENFRSSIRSNLQDLLQMSYKREYKKNQNLLYYFLEEIENAYIEFQPDIENICQQILYQSFQKLQYFHIA